MLRSLATTRHGGMSARGIRLHVRLCDLEFKFSNDDDSEHVSAWHVGMAHFASAWHVSSRGICKSLSRLASAWHVSCFIITHKRTNYAYGHNFMESWILWYYGMSMFFVNVWLRRGCGAEMCARSVMISLSAAFGWRGNPRTSFNERGT